MKFSRSIGGNNIYFFTRAFGVIGIIVLIAALITREPILFFLGLCFFLIGAIAEFFRIKRVKEIAMLKKEGMLIKASVGNIEINDSLTVNGRSPFRIVCQWLDPKTNQVHMFNSENIWYNPAEYIDRNEVDVFVLPGNYKKYYMDTSFLPEVAN